MRFTCIAAAVVALASCKGDPASTTAPNSPVGAAGSTPDTAGVPAADSGSEAPVAGNPAQAGGGGSPEPGAAGPPAAGGNPAAGSGEPSAGTSAAIAGSGAAGSPAPEGPIAAQLDITDVWSGHPVGFDLVTHGEHQFAVFYDQNRALTVASRKLDETTWRLTRLPSTLGWDSHNAAVLALDADGFLHLAANMHSSPLVYFRSTRAFDASTLERVPTMVGRDEDACTYPQFFHTADGQLVFMYRSGSSGNGNHIFNRYDHAARSWRRLLGSPLTDGEGQRNAYPVGPTQGPDGTWHLVWVWRDTPDASTNHDLSYARTSDLVAWQNAAGRALTLPIRLSNSDVVDPVPAGGGMINNNTKVGFDAQMRPIVAYHKYDRTGRTQLYNARFEDGRWSIHQTSQWDYRWEFGGNGTLIFEIRVEPVELLSDGTLIQRFYHQRLGGEGAFRLSPETLAAEASIEPPVPYPVELARPQSRTPGMEVHWQADHGSSAEPGLRYLLRWETLPENRDMPRANVPPPTRLQLFAFR